MQIIGTEINYTVVGVARDRLTQYDYSCFGCFALDGSQLDIKSIEREKCKTSNQIKNWKYASPINIQLTFWDSVSERSHQWLLINGVQMRR